jgi:hypothetical protein
MRLQKDFVTEEDRTELDAHLAERVQAYIELGETPEQAEISAREKFGETETVVRDVLAEGSALSDRVGLDLCDGLRGSDRALQKLVDEPDVPLFYALYFWKSSRCKAS